MLRTLLILLLTAPTAFADEFDFRGEPRPEYERTMTAKELAASDKIIVLDVRLKEDFEADPQLIPGALRRDPERIAEWAGELPADTPIVAYCVRGKWVSQKAADFLARQGKDVYSLEGGIEAWKTASARTPE